jgi:bacterioferritin
MMAGQDALDGVIEILNECLTAELTAINQYFLHGELCRSWGYNKLYGVQRKNAIEEMKHAEVLMERILYLNGLPNVQRIGNVKIGESVPEQFDLDLALEKNAIERLNAGIQTCRESGDNGSRLLLETILADEERHLDWLEAQLVLIEKVGEQNYLAQQMGTEGE